MLLNNVLGEEGIELSCGSGVSDIISPEVLINRMKGKKVVFFTGAGFSKAWNKMYPSGDELFFIDNIRSLEEKYNFFCIAPHLGIKKPSNTSASNYSDDCLRFFKEIKFHLDIYRRYPSLLPHFLDKTIINKLEDEIRLFIKERFSTLVGESEFDIEKSENENKNLKEILHSLEENCKSISFITTNYDFIVEKIFFDKEVYLTRGVINRNDFENINLNKKRISLYKINGGFDVFKGPDSFFVDHYNQESSCPNIILPSQEQNYDDQYFKSVFKSSVSKLREADCLVFIGYTLPKEDHTIRFLLKNFTDSDESNDKEIFIVSKDKENAFSDIYPNVTELFYELHNQEAIKVLDGDMESLFPYI
ncbi:SIR2 family protein [Vibrio parahaemolyticus]|nr:SIR2 family protein [Vibrio parahaemolyticus]HCM1501783.1 SIR2 family protein [Vibrio parahaemolyticus]